MKKKEQSYTRTLFVCYLAYTVQALVNNTSPVLFTLYQSEFGVSMAKLSAIVLINFGAQLVIDLLSIRLFDFFGYRKLALFGHFSSFIGLVGLGVTPLFIPPFAGILLSTIFCALGSGLIEVIVSPIVDAIPQNGKTSALNLLHSFYCWGSVICVALTTVGIRFIGNYWYWIPVALSLIPLVNFFSFFNVRLVPSTESQERTPVRRLLASPLFRAGMVMMLCSGAAEMAMSQWASLFVEKGLGVSKLIGDLLGPCFFAVLMGTGRLLMRPLSERFRMETLVFGASLLSVACYLTTALVPSPVVSMLSCALTGFAVSVLWPSTLTIGSSNLQQEGTTMFSLFAFAGDGGCTAGPFIAGEIADRIAGTPLCESIMLRTGMTMESVTMRAGLLVSTVFCIVMAVAAYAVMRMTKSAGVHPNPRN